MTFPHRALIIAGLLGLGALAIGAGSASSAPSNSASTRLAKVLADADESDLTLSPLNALSRGDLRYADQYGDGITDNFYAAAKANLLAQQRALGSVPRAELQPKERIAFDVFQYQVEQALLAHSDGANRLAQRMPVDHLFGAHISFPQFSSGEGVAPFKTVADYDNGLKRLKGFVTYLDRTIPMMRRGLASGHVHIRVVAEKIIAQLDEAARAGVDASPFMGPTRKFPETFSAQDRARLTSAYRAAVQNDVLPAYARLAKFMKTEYLPKSRTGAPGLASLPDGAKLYAFHLRQHTTTNMSAEDIHFLGVKEVTRIRAEMEAIMKQVGFTGSLAEFFKHLRDDSKFKYTSGEELLADYANIRKTVDAALPRVVARAPKSALEIRAVPKEQESSAGGAYYVVGTPDGVRPGVFYINTSNLPTRTRPRMTALYLHEALPGHHLQGSLAQEDATLPALLRFNWNAGYGEGWALYSEWLGEELGLNADPYQRFGRLDLEIIRAARLVVDTGFHAKGWTRDEAIRYLAENSSLDLPAVEQEIDRYIVWPGQAVAYKLGDIFIRSLRAKATAALGPRFDVREFHEEVLNTGAIPLAVLEKKIVDWVKVKQTAGG